MRLQPVLQRRIDARLPPRAGGFEGVHHFGRQADRGDLLGRQAGRWTAASHQLAALKRVGAGEEVVRQLRGVVAGKAEGIERTWNDPFA